MSEQPEVNRPSAIERAIEIVRNPRVDKYGFVREDQERGSTPGRTQKIERNNTKEELERSA